jgi:ABC-2 type transport system ATP-binding protein
MSTKHGPSSIDRTAVEALSVLDVSHSFGRREALKGVSLSVPQGRFVALLGPNGAGKTTLFSIATRLYANRAGAVSIFGHDLSRASSLALRELGVVFQARTLDADLTVRQNLAYHAALHGLSGHAVRQRIERVLSDVGLDDRIDEKVRTLSGGQARRAEIARALLHSPRLLLLDEPTVGLDLGSRAAITDTVRRLVCQEGLAVLWATHILDEIAADDFVYVLSKGRIVAEAPASVLAAERGSTLATAFRELTELPQVPP